MKKNDLKNLSTQEWFISIKEYKNVWLLVVKDRYLAHQWICKHSLVLINCKAVTYRELK